MVAGVPENSRDLFEKKSFVRLSTVMPDGRPQVTPVWSRRGWSTWSKAGRRIATYGAIQKWCRRYVIANPLIQRKDILHFRATRKLPAARTLHVPRGGNYPF